MEPLWENIRSVLKEIQLSEVGEKRQRREGVRKHCKALKEKEASMKNKGSIRKCDGE